MAQNRYAAEKSSDSYGPLKSNRPIGLRWSRLVASGRVQNRPTTGGRNNMEAEGRSNRMAKGPGTGECEPGAVASQSLARQF
jgi:hypothetical protein